MFISDAVGGLFTTEEGVQDFLNWLQDESGYNAKEKKAILQRITEWLNGIIEAIRDIMNSGELNGAGALFAKENYDELTRIRKQFLEALDGAGVNYREGGAVEGDVRNSLIIKRSDGSVEELADARTLTDEQALKYLNQARRGELRRTSYIPVRKDTPQVIIDTVKQVGEEIDNLSLVMQVRKAQQSMALKSKKGHSKKVGNNIRVHALTPNQILEIVNNLDNPSLMIYQTERYDKNGKPLPNNVAVFVEYNNGENEGVAVVEFDSEIDSEYIGIEYGETNYHTVVTVFEPDIIRDGAEYDYAQELLENPNNIELEIKRRPLKESATGEKHPNTFNELSSNNSISDSFENVKNSLTVNLDKTIELSKLEAEKKKYDDEVFSLRRDFDKLKRTDEYERLETAVVEARGNDEAFNAAIDEYNKWLKESGMGEINRKLTEAKAKQSELYKEITRMQNELHKDFIKSVESFDDETVSKYVGKAVRKFKTTNSFKLAGYLTTTGSLLDFSDGQGYRVQDHREVKDVLDMPDYAEYSDGMIAFMNMGNIRLQSYGIDISKMPNTKQISVLRRFFNSLNGEVTVDFSLPDGHTDGSIEYPENTKADRILNDIKKYFETGVVPELSTVDRFRYSLPLSNLNDLHRSNIEKVTELSRVAAQMTAHINYIGSSQTKRVLSALNIQAVARELKSEYRSKADIHKLSAALTELYEKYEAGRVPYDVATAHIDNIVDMIINESVYM